MKLYFGDFADEVDMLSKFQEKDLGGHTVLYAHYDGGGYDGAAYCLTEKDGVLYENEASHCSCYGLEGQWEPAPITIDYLTNRLAMGGSYGMGDRDDLKAAVVAYTLRTNREG